ncbi:hypothetical protein PAXRUDRAFT_824366 [Paxillus rubicundulus Ve08.2h10]|uniref:Uncharacterized protein n=1 Tax=Paxillus rubicundulus Ve08.2h10 TaxID=930991 RepID=A0A0D0E7V8_9AGAM|nr:hypothetical protein PAXRUDRAFT_824366 [Paxillus rubicundulus Ve08.2h10]
MFGHQRSVRVCHASLPHVSEQLPRVHLRSDSSTRGSPNSDCNSYSLSPGRDFQHWHTFRNEGHLNPSAKAKH